MPESGEASSPDAVDFPRHGGDLAFASEQFGVPADGWLDLSTGINPNPYPSPVIAGHQLAHLPDRGDLTELLETARRAYDVPETVGLIAVPGSEVAARLVPVVAPPGAVAIVAPTYGAHVEAWRHAGRSIVEVASVDAIAGDVAFAVIGNPNNPDGRTTEPGVLADLARRLDAKGGFLVVDEAFADTAPDISLVPHLVEAPALVLRSFGKFYGLAGIRLGFVAGPKAVLDRLAALLGDWPVSSIAIAIGRTALADGEWRNRKRRRLKNDAKRLRELLVRHRLTVKGGTDLFVLVEDAKAAALYRGLAGRGIWTRVFASEPTWLRIGLPTEEGFARLDRALGQIR